MLSNISKYVYEVYRQKSVSLAAKKLYISQPALSAAIQKAEKELGAPIFDRRTLPFSLTPEGKIYIDALEQMLIIQKQTEVRLQDMNQIHGGTLRIGSAAHLSYYIIPKVLELFYRRYPQVDVKIFTVDPNKVLDLLEKGVADIVLMTTDTLFDDYITVPLFEETLVVAMPANTPGIEPLEMYAVTYEELLHKTYPNEKLITDTSLFRNFEFIYNPPDTYMHKKKKNLFGKTELIPYITSNTNRQQLNYNLMLSGFGAVLTTDANIATMPSKSDCKYFVVGGPAAKQNFSMVYSKLDKTQSLILRNFIDIAQDLFSCEHPFTILAP